MEIKNEYRATLIIALTEFQRMLKDRILENAKMEMNGETQPDFFENCIINDAYFYERTKEILGEIVKKGDK